ncbi:MAG: peptidoglycan editing factor PgeF [candidate division NC10 bacterium]|nr:peptidoglycan editing factor PgeF [candidate division NC10 bacterium]
MEEILRSRAPGVLQHRVFHEMGLVHAFSTREGGVSRSLYHSLNLSVSVGDDPEAVKENRRRFFSALGVDPSRVVRVRQVHGDGVLVVGEELVRRKGFPPILLDEGTGYDALTTNQPRLALTITTADCLPILLFDPRKRAIGAVHAGWRSTVKRIAERAVKAMATTYGTAPSDLLAILGPGIGGCCYEVDEAVIQPLSQALSSWQAYVVEKEDGRFLLDLAGVNQMVFQEAGVLPEHLFLTRLCTACRPDLFYSYRAEKPKTGRMLNLIMLPS